MEAVTSAEPGVVPQLGETNVDQAVDLAPLALPASLVRRIARSAAPPGTRFSSDALAALHRVAQVYILYACDRACSEGQQEKNEKMKKSKKGVPVAGGGSRRMTAEHVMRFIAADLSPVAAKVATLFPDLMPLEFKPPAVRLLQELREQERSREELLAPPQSASADGDRHTEEGRDVALPAKRGLDASDIEGRCAEDVEPPQKRHAAVAATPTMSSFFGKRPTEQSPFKATTLGEPQKLKGTASEAFAPCAYKGQSKVELEPSAPLASLPSVKVDTSKEEPEDTQPVAFAQAASLAAWGAAVGGQA
eukprot:TRINITY_DN67869_c0_g1_i1.p1 TRINITY_DN67869_c0_g1~~TRINITY_DN67869_c0_g1_i1.p1  ORF type:complete len:350 (+),score=60.79 TRINITY_DN67869_c0_g1_i1:134-1051(+)